MRLKKNMLTDSVAIFFIKVYGSGMNFLFAMLAGYVFEAGNYGLYTLAISIFNFLDMIAKFGLENSLIKYVSICREEGYDGTIKKMLRKSAVLSVLISCILYILVIVFAGVICDSIFKKADLRPLLYLIAFASIPHSVGMILNSAWKGMGKLKSGLFLSSAFVPSVNVILFLILIFGFGVRSHIILGVIYLTGTMLFFIFEIALWIKMGQKMSQKEKEDYEFKSVVDTARPLLFVASANYLVSSTDTLMLGMMCEEEEVGTYGISNKITMFPSMILSAVNAVLGPRFSVLYSQGKMSDLKRIMQTASRIMFLGAIVICAFFIVFAKWIVMLLGDSFAGAEVIVIIVAIGQFFVLATGPVATLLMMTGREKMHRNNTLVCAILNVVLNLCLIPVLGAVGAALASAIALTCKNLIATYLVYKEFKFFIW